MGASDSCGRQTAKAAQDSRAAARTYRLSSERDGFCCLSRHGPLLQVVPWACWIRSLFAGMARSYR